MSFLLDHALPPGADADPLNGDTEEVLDELHVLLAVHGERVERGRGGDACLPARKRHVLDLDLVEDTKVRW